jgi:chromosome segregation protein
VTFAYWRKCDFQVHTPRDPNWVGAGPIGQGEVIKETGEKATPKDVDAARARWASEFVDQCIAKRLEAIALTDHHEMIMVPYVQEAIAARKKADAHFDLWLLPGMELTASGGVQCLILFDSELSEDWRKQAQGKLGIIFMPIWMRKAGKVQRSLN